MCKLLTSRRPKQQKRIKQLWLQQTNERSSAHVIDPAAAALHGEWSSCPQARPATAGSLDSKRQPSASTGRIPSRCSHVPRP